MFAFQRIAATATAVVTIAALAACAAPYNGGYNQGGYNQGGYNQGGYSQGGYGNQGGYNQGSGYVQGYGRVTNVQMVRGQGGSGLTGAVIGGAVGGLAGNQVGGGSGRTAATIAGLAAGALIGRAVEQNSTRAQGRDYYRVTVQLDNGQMHSLDYADAPSVRIGDRVRLDGNQIYR